MDKAEESSSSVSSDNCNVIKSCESSVPVWHRELVRHQRKSDIMIRNYHEEVEKQNQQAVKNGKNNIDNCRDFCKDSSHLIGNDESNSFCA